MIRIVENEEPEVRSSELVENEQEEDTPTPKMKQIAASPDLKQAQQDLEHYKNYLDELSTQTLMRVENLSQIEISLFERELALKNKEDGLRLDQITDID